jgi:hypothetical protein
LGSALLRFVDGADDRNRGEEADHFRIALSFHAYFSG